MTESWEQTIATFKEIFGDETVTPEPGVLPVGKNMMTPEVLGYIMRDGITVEISAGTGFDNTSRLIGVTFCEWGSDGEWLAGPRSKCCHSWDEVREAVA